MNTTPPRRQFLATGTALTLGGLGGVFAQLGWAEPALAASTQAAPPAGSNWHNWSGIQTALAQALPTPASEAELQALLARSTGEIRAVGSGHSFTALVPTSGTIVSLDRMSGVISVDKQAMTATVKGGTRLGVLARALEAQGLGLRNQPDVDVQTIAGAISTGTHGTGATLPALHDDVIALRIVKPNGEVVDINAQRQPEWLAAARVSLGSLGVISQVTLRVLPAYNLQRKVWLQPIESLLQQAPQLAQQHRHFEMYYLPFTGYGAAIAHDVYTGNDLYFPKAADDDVLADLRKLRDWLGRFPKLRQWAASKLIDPSMTEEARQRSWKLLSSVRPVKFNESEWHVPREQGVACLRDIIQTIEKHNEAFFPIEFRFIKGDGAWLSPFYGRESCSIAVHAAADEPYQYLIDDCAPIYRRHGGRPHWGKLHLMGTRELSAMYPKWSDFQAVRQQFDPQGRMLNAHLRKLFANA
ncbi:D-arabinono-1,4-lactone oxidase [Aquabacterium sp.]|uniref:D-arabinono-1,4-lactone oxidase n=1 Tax=Aquabacterium sp. TaxID=1872578 RepID=UPI002E2EECF6|nr:D-arabinono-1,4-lactone oxidase [Aquabacterium sp.]HEX5310851.1 D-arabinono-1,4-lactone oxidase [Aquabacterium sp.]